MNRCSLAEGLNNRLLLLFPPFPPSPVAVARLSVMLSWGANERTSTGEGVRSIYISSFLTTTAIQRPTLSSLLIAFSTALLRRLINAAGYHVICEVTGIVC